MIIISFSWWKLAVWFFTTAASRIVSIKNNSVDKDCLLMMHNADYQLEANPKIKSLYRCIPCLYIICKWLLEIWILTSIYFCCSLLQSTPVGKLGGNAIGAPMYGEMTMESFDKLLNKLMDFVDTNKLKLRYHSRNWILFLFPCIFYYHSEHFLIFQI